MTTPRKHAEMAARFMADDTLKCWYLLRDPDIPDEWELVVEPVWNADIECHVGHEPPPVKRTITLIVNGKTWVLPEPLREAPERGYYLINEGDGFSFIWNNDPHEMRALKRSGVHATRADARAWAEFDRAMRNGGK